MAYPANYKYTKEHEWLQVDGTPAPSASPTTPRARSATSSSSSCPRSATSIEAGTTFGSVESVKAVSDLYSPVTGTVTEINEALNAAPETINTDANTTWLIKIDAHRPASRRLLTPPTTKTSSPKRPATS